MSDEEIPAEPEVPAELEDAAASFETEEDEEHDSPYRRASAAERDLIKSLNSAARVARLHALENTVTQEVLNEFSTRLRAFLAGGKDKDLTVAQGYGRISVNGASIKPKRHGRNWVTDWLSLMEQLGIGALILGGTWTQDSCTELLRVLQEAGTGAPELRVERVAKAAGRLIREPATLRVLDPEEARALAGQDDDDDLPDTERAIFLYARLLALTEASVIAVRGGRSPDFQVRHLRSTLMRVIESLRAGLFEVRLLALTALPHRAQEPLASQLVNTAVLSLSCARLLGLPRGHLIDLGFGAIYSDMGRAVLGREAFLAHEGDDLDQSETPAILSVASALRGRGYGSAGLLRLAVAEESRRVLTQAATAGMRPPHPCSRIVALCAEFGRRTAGTPWAPPQSPARVIRDLQANPASPQTCLQLLVDVLGTRPRGSVVRRSNGEVGVVIDGGSRRGDKCVVRILSSGGRLLTRSRLVEVQPSESMEDVSPAAVEIDWAKVLLQ